MNESSFLGEIPDLRDEARRIDILIIPSLFTLVSLVSSRFFFLPFLLVRLQIRKIKILSRYTLPFNLLPDRITLHLLEHVVTTLRSVHARLVMYVPDTHARERRRANTRKQVRVRCSRSGTSNRGVKSNGFNFCLDSPTSLLPLHVGGCICIRPLRAFTGLARSLSLVSRWKLVALEGVLQAVCPIRRGFWAIRLGSSHG